MVNPGVKPLKKGDLFFSVSPTVFSSLPCSSVSPADAGFSLFLSLSPYWSFKKINKAKVYLNAILRKQSHKSRMLEVLELL